jgi:CDP-diacylglycerol--glycerol-3-phosphate 3-phosphatidyltransferase
MSVQCVAVTVSLLSLSTDLPWPWLPTVRDVLLWIAVAITVWSGFVYLLRGFSLLRQG